MNRKAVILFPGTKYLICCDVNFLPEFMNYVMSNERHRKEMNLILCCVMEGLKTPKYSSEDFSTKAMKPFLNRENDRIICNVTRRKNKKQCIVMAEAYYKKKSDNVNKVLKNRYKIVGSYEYEIIESC